MITSHYIAQKVLGTKAHVRAYIVLEQVNDANLAKSFVTSLPQFIYRNLQ
jgi:fructose-specific component phosphotransferase system IIB-like protein